MPQSDPKDFVFFDEPSSISTCNVCHSFLMVRNVKQVMEAMLNRTFSTFFAVDEHFPLSLLFGSQEVNIFWGLLFDQN